MSVYAPLLGISWHALEAHGHDPAKVIDAKHYRPDRWPPVPERISSRVYDTITARAITLIDDPTLGLQVGDFLHPFHLGAVGGAWLASSSLRNAMMLIARFVHNHNTQLDLRIEELPDRIRAVYEYQTPRAFPDIFGDSWPASLYSLCNKNLGRKLVPLEVTLSRSKPEDPGPWYDYFGVEVRFAQPLNGLSISLDDADKPLTGGNPELVAIHEEIMQKQLLKINRDNIIYRARLSIMERLPSGRVTSDLLASDLNMSRRTLHRKLHENDENFRNLLLSVRKDLAQLYIRSNTHSITDITFMLGYADTSAFSRAFKAWFGSSPTLVRQLVS